MSLAASATTMSRFCIRYVKVLFRGDSYESVNPNGKFFSMRCQLCAHNEHVRQESRLEKNKSKAMDRFFSAGE